MARSVKMAHHTLDFVGEVFDALLPVMEEGAAPVAELAARPELARYGISRVRSAVLKLIVSGQLAPLLRPTRAPPAPEGMCRLPSAYNRTVLQRPLSADAPFALASPVAGTGIVLSLLQVVALRLLTEVEPSDRPGWIHAFATEQPFALRSGNDRTTEGAPTETAVLEEVDRMRREQLGKLVELGVVTPA
jgi:hypothetical protein